MENTDTETTTRTINPAAMERRVGEMGDWKVEGSTMSCAFSFDDEQDAAKFAARVVRRAKTAARPIDMRLDGPSITLSFAQKDGGFTPDDIKLARQLSNSNKGDEKDAPDATTTA